MAYEKLENSARETRYVPWIAGSLPLAYYVAGASAHGGLFEEGSFVAAARSLGVAHPPGAPIESLLGATFALLPIGPLSFRVSLASAVCAALTLALFARALLLTLSHIGLSDARCAGLLALAGSLGLAQTPLFFAEAVRPHVFASQFALSMLIMYTLLRFEASEPHGTTRVLYFGAFVQGLCFANHHVYGLLMLPLAAPTLGRVFARRGFIGLMGHLAAPLIGFSTYLYVPLRLAHDPDSGAAQQSGVVRLLSVLGAEPYPGPGYIAPAPLDEALQRGLGLGHPWWLSLGAGLWLVGAWVSLRSSHRRRFGTLWLLAVLVPLASAWLSLRPRLLADAWGVLLPCAAGLIAIACAGAGALLSRCGEYSMRSSRLLALGLALLATLGFSRHSGSAQVALVELGDRADDLARRELAADAVLFTSEAGAAFRLLGREAEEQLRPDLTLVPLALGTLPHAIDSWARRSPELADSLRSWVLRERLDTGNLQSLSAERAVYVEPGTPSDLELYRASLDEGLLLRVFSDGPTLTDLRAERGAQAARLGRLYVPTHAGRALRDAGLAPALSRAHLFQALARAALGDREGAHDYLVLSEGSGFADARQLRLDLALRNPARLDLRALLEPGAP
ncbi:MAG TPA: DUF2723 domain-containing protein [Polyangiales bacterium]